MEPLKTLATLYSFKIDKDGEATIVFKIPMTEVHKIIGVSALIDTLLELSIEVKD